MSFVDTMQRVANVAAWAQRHKLVNLPLTPAERAQLKAPPAEDPEVGVLAYLGGVSTVERGGRLAVWTVLGLDGRAVGDVRRHYQRRRPLDAARQQLAARQSMRRIEAARQTHGVADALRRIVASITRPLTPWELRNLESRWVNRYPHGCFARFMRCEEAEARYGDRLLAPYPTCAVSRRPL